MTGPSGFLKTIHHSPRLLLEASIGRGRPSSCWELLAAVPPGDKPLPATELP
ncbi:hypothetical protein ALC56_03063 [Trachymyrmex septentrionalis]|uniref:Uncharacterized protein n=1 Tax=Trachymyrmex septentrionalis TaxID=34720 RepID=A0A195FQF1_9HYME|nr:hypothetical protein ALC56_03063 [Trachymyrmex septentrionalis]